MVEEGWLIFPPTFGHEAVGAQEIRIIGHYLEHASL